MNRLSLVVGLFLFWMDATNSIWAQSKVPSPVHPVVNTSAHNPVTNSPTHAFNMQLMSALKAVAKDEKTGKVTPVQAQSLLAKIKAIRVQEWQFMKTNGDKQLTPQQINQLTRQLNALNL